MAMAKTYQLSTKLFFSVLDLVIPSHLIMMISVWAAVDQIEVGCGLSGLWAALGVQTIFWVVCCQEIGCDWCGQLFVTSYILDGWQCFCKWTQWVLEYVLRDRKEPLAFGFALRKRDIRKKCIYIWKYKGSGKILYIDVGETCPRPIQRLLLIWSTVLYSLCISLCFLICLKFLKLRQCKR